MTPREFGRDYASVYDDLYQDKDYLAEVDLLENLMKLYGQRPVRRVLDLGCGTGGHAVPLAQRGYEVVGVDRSPEMITRARSRSGSTGLRFEVSSIATVDLGQEFDAVLMMFAVLGYQVGNADVQAALATAKRHLHRGGLLFCDFWYGPAVLTERPAERVKVIGTSGGQVIRVASGELDPLHDLCLVRYHVWRIESDTVTADVREQHVMRYFFAPELDLFLAAAGFELVRLGAFPAFDEQPTEKTWSVALVARAL